MTNPPLFHTSDDPGISGETHKRSVYASRVPAKGGTVGKTLHAEA